MTTREDTPSDVQQVCIVTRYEIEKHMQSRAFIGIMALVSLILVLLTVIRPILGLDFASDSASFVSDYVSWVEILILIGAVAFASGALSSEFEKRTGLLMFPQPIKRETYLIGKYLSTLVVIGAALGVYYIVVAVLSLAITGGVPATIMLSFGFAMIYTMAACAVAFLFSSILKTNTASIVAMVLVFMMVFSIVGALLAMSNVDPFFMPSNAAGVISYSLEDPYPVSSTTQMGMNMTTTTYVPSELGATLVLLGWTVGSLVVAVVAFKRRQF